MMMKKDPLWYDVVMKSVSSREKYDEFLQLMKDFKADRINPRDVRVRLKELFKGDNQHLIDYVINKLPDSYQILPLYDDHDYQHHPITNLDVQAFHRELEDLFKDNVVIINDFNLVTKDFEEGLMDTIDLYKEIYSLFKGNPDLLLKYNKFLPIGYQYNLPFIRDDAYDYGDDHEQQQAHQLAIKDAVAFLTGEEEKVKKNRKKKKMKVVTENYVLPWDALYIISQKLDFVDLFPIGCVCKNWREFHKIYWRDFMPLQDPLLVQMSSHVEKTFYFISIFKDEVHDSKVMSYFWHFAYIGSSSGYLIMTGYNNSFILINPFTRDKKVIKVHNFKVNVSYYAYNVLLAFGKGTEEFVLVTLCKRSNNLHVYQSRNFGWTSFCIMGYPCIVVDFVVLHNTIYVVTNKAKIGVLNLNSTNIKFLELKSTPAITSLCNLRLVSCDGQLLVLHNMSSAPFTMYKIDFSTMNYVKLNTLGGIALFDSPEEKYYSLSNPDKWGYERNSMYTINYSNTKCIVHLGDDNKLPRYIKQDIPHEDPIGRPYLLGWCFRHLQHEVDYSI